MTDEKINAFLTDGRLISVPFAWSWRLSNATPEQRSHWEIIGTCHGIHWSGIDEDLIAEGLLRCFPARRLIWAKG